MDRPGLSIIPIAVFAAFGCVVACGSVTSSGHASLDPQSPATVPSVGETSREAVSRASLAYHVAFAGPYLVSIELTTRFALVVRDRRDSNRSIRRVDLGPADHDVLALETTSDGKRAYVASRAGWVRAYQLDTGALLSEWHMGSSATSLALDDSDTYLAIGTSTGVVCLRRLRDSALLQCVAAHPSHVAALDTRGSSLISGDEGGEVALWVLPSLREVERIAGEGFISDLAISGEGTTVAIARNRRRPVRSPELNAREEESPAVDAIGHNVVEIRPLTAHQIGASKTLAGHRSVISALAWVGPDLISTSWDRSARIWDPHASGAVRTLVNLPHLASDVAASETGGQVAISSWATDDAHASVTMLRLLYPHQ